MNTDLIEAKEIVLVPLKDIKLNPKNRNKHTPEQIDHLARIIKKTGFRRPGTISNRSGFLNCGEGRYLAAKKIGMTHMPVMYQDYESEALEYADAIADNALDKQAELDNASILQDVLDLGPEFDFDLLGIPDFKLPEDFDPQSDEDSVPEHVEPKTKLGDLYKLGEHRLLCGDSTSIDAVDRLMYGEKADMVFTSPPYNVGISYNSHDDKMSLDDYADFMKSVMTCAYAILNSGRIIAWNVGVSPKSAPHKHVNWLEESGFTLYRNIVWKKTGCQIPLWQNSKKNPLARYYLPNYNHEMIYLASKGEVEKGGPTEMPEELCMDVWDISQFSAGGNNHPAAFPVHLAEMTVKVLSSKDEIAFEPFGGSGSTLIACEKTKRKCFMMELDPHYCDVIVARWEKYTGKKAELING